MEIYSSLDNEAKMRWLDESYDILRLRVARNKTFSPLVFARLTSALCNNGRTNSESNIEETWAYGKTIAE